MVGFLRAFAAATATAVPAAAAAACALSSSSSSSSSPSSFKLRFPLPSSFPSASASSVPSTSARAPRSVAPMATAAAATADLPAADKDTALPELTVMYDASGIRFHTGRQAALLNQIVCDFPPEHPIISTFRPLREPLGHSPLQVFAGALVGCAVAYVIGKSV